MLLGDTLDDVLPMLLLEDRQKVEKIGVNFWNEVAGFGSYFDEVLGVIVKEYKTKKDYAISGAGTRAARSIIFMMWDGKVASGAEAVTRFISRSLGTQKKYEAMQISLRGKLWKL